MSSARCTVATGASMRTPSASSTSALPQVPLAERLPCLATGTPQAATTNDATVEMLKVPAPSPPVPQVSTAPCEVSGTARARIARAKPTTSSSVSPRAAIAPRSAPIWAGVASPSMIEPMAAAASSSASRSPRATFARWRLMLTFAPRPRKLRSRSLPAVVRMLSGWNCTPSSGRSRWRRPITTPPSVQADTSRQSGTLSGATTSEW